LCAGLAAAHAQGVLHRDLKPANVLIDDDGLVRITDFGIAIPRTAAGLHMLTGTPAYMAPEQRVMGTALSEQTDVYALGLVLYELLVGRYAFNRSGEATQPPLPSTLVPNVNPLLERVVMQALSPDPRNRPPSALAVAASLPAIGAGRDTGLATASAPPSRGTTWWLAGAAIAAVVGALAVAPSLFVSSDARTLTEQDTIVLADFENTTGEPVFDGALKVALAVALEQSPFLKVFPDDRVHETLRFMERAPDDRVTRSIARDIARREQFKALIAGSIASLGRHYVVSLEAVNAESGDVMAREQVEAASKEEVLTSLGGAVSRLRRKLGESLTSIQRYDVPLPRATTPSLEALQAYALALEDGRINDQRLDSISRLKRAIELDPNFALALAQLSGTYANTWQSALAPEWSRRAFELRARVSERERFIISWRYYRDATQAWDKGLELARSWTAAYPRESTAFNSLGFAAWSLGQYQQAIAPLRESIRLDTRFFAPRLNLVWTLTSLNRFDEAKKVLEGARADKVDHIGFHQMAYVLAFMDNDAAIMTRELDATLAKPEGPWASNWQPRISAFGGHAEKAHREFRLSVAATSQANLTELSGLYSAQDAISHAVVGQCAEARREAAAAIRLSRDNFTLESAGRALAWCGADADASNLSGELARRFPDAILTTRVVLPVIAAATAIRNRRPARGLELLEPVRPFDHAPVAEFWPAYLRGEAQLQLGRHSEAADEFRSVIDHRGELIDSSLYSLAHLGLARALASAGNRADARQAYLAFFTLWKDADPNLPPLTEARREFARLQP
jgi:tetratricopeptide (TPR) repeat protein